MAYYNIAIGVIGLVSSMSAADSAAAASSSATKEKREQQEKQAEFELAKNKIAQQIQGRANEIHNIWTSYYLPQELVTLAEVCSEPEVQPNLALVSQRAIAEASKKFSLARRSATYGLNPQHVGVRAEVEFDIATQQADTISGLVLKVVKAERERVNVVNKQNLDNRMAMINAGRGHTVNVSSGLNEAAKMYSDLSKDAQQAIANAGYVQGRALHTLVEQGKEVVKGKNPLINLLRGQDSITPAEAPYVSGSREAPTINIQTDAIRERQTQNNTYGGADQYNETFGEE